MPAQANGTGTRAFLPEQRLDVKFDVAGCNRRDYESLPDQRSHVHANGSRPVNNALDFVQIGLRARYTVHIRLRGDTSDVQHGTCNTQRNSARISRLRGVLGHINLELEREKRVKDIPLDGGIANDRGVERLKRERDERAKQRAVREPIAESIRSAPVPGLAFVWIRLTRERDASLL